MKLQFFSKSAFLSLWFSMVMSSCATNPDTRSAWTELKTAKSVSCKPWPKKPSDLRVLHLTAFGSREAPSALVSRAQARSGAITHYYALFDGDYSLDQDDLGIANWGGAQFIHAMSQGKNWYALVQHRGALELRDLKKNVVETKLKKNVPALDGIQIGEGQLGKWLLGRKQDPDVSPVDQPVQVHHLKVDRSGIALTDVKAKGVYGDPKIVRGPKGYDALFWLDEGTSDKVSAPRFRYNLMTSSNAQTKKFQLALNPKQVEGWDVIAYGNRILLAFVEGDSLLGDATLKIVSFRYSLESTQIEWQKQIPLPDLHAGNPHLVAVKGSVYLFLPTWVDEESSLATLKIEGLDVDNLGYQGVFAEGTQFVQIHYDTLESDLIGIAKNRKTLTSPFQLCRLTHK